MESEFFTALIIVVSLLLFLGAGVWIFAAMFVVSIAGLYFLQDFSWIRIGSLINSVQWRAMTSFELAALPMFILMAEILFRTRLSEQIFRGFSPWVTRLPGGLLHVVVLACGLFGSVCGSSAATCATISKIAMPELRKRRYDENVTTGALVAGGSLGILIPPSIIMVLYAVAAEVSLIKLFLAGFLPGFLLMALFSLYIGGYALWNPSIAPPDQETMTLRERLGRLSELLPITILIVFIFGALFAGLITATECAAWGVVGAMLLALHSRTLTLRNLYASIMETVCTTTMLVLLIGAAGVMSSFMAFAGIPAALARTVDAMQLTPLGLILVLTILYIILGMFLEGVSMMLLTLPVVLPMVTMAGFDPIWFGIYLIMVIELGMMTPPVGFNLFVIQSLTGRDLLTLGKASFPFFLVMCVSIIMMTVWPEIVMVLPDLYSK